MDDNFKCFDIDIQNCEMKIAVLIDCGTKNSNDFECLYFYFLSRKSIKTQS